VVEGDYNPPLLLAQKKDHDAVGPSCCTAPLTETGVLVGKSIFTENCQISEIENAFEIREDGLCVTLWHHSIFKEPGRSVGG